MSGAIDSLLTSLGPLTALAIVAVIVFAESGVLAGFFLPGDSLLFTTGLLVASGTVGVPIGVVAIVVALAAVAGDQVGYLIGRRLGPKVLSKPRSRLLDPAHLERAASFFDRHGARAVILARFVPIARTFTPVAAGAGRMPYRTFVAYNVIGGVAWSAAMLAAGHLLGGVAFVNAHIELLTLGIVAVSLAPAAVSLVRHNTNLRRRIVPWCVGAGSAICVVAVLLLADAATERDSIAASDPSITATVVGHRTGPLTALAQVVTLVGGEVSIGVLSAVLVGSLVIARRYRAALWAAVAMGGTAVLVVGIKHLVLRHRPGAGSVIGPVDHSYSFPSGHTLFSTVFVAVLVALVWRRLRSRSTRWVTVTAAVAFALAVGASRIYLGYHWATDVLAAWLLAVAWCGTLYLVVRPRQKPGDESGERLARPAHRQAVISR